MMTSSSVRSAKRAMKCQARYKVVRMNLDTKGVHHSLHCKICGQPLTPTHEGHILKYFLVRRPSAARGS